MNRQEWAFQQGYQTALRSLGTKDYADMVQKEMNLSPEQTEKIRTYFKFIDTVNQFPDDSYDKLAAWIMKAYNSAKATDIADEDVALWGQMDDTLKQVKQLWDKFFDQSSTATERKWQLPEGALDY